MADVDLHAHGQGVQIGGASGPMLHARANWAVFFYRCSECFNALWQRTPKQLKTGGYLIVWDGYPPGCETPLRSILDFITPLDWAFAMTYEATTRASDRPNQKEILLPNVAVLDFLSHRHAGSFAINARLALCDALPNVKWFTGFDRYGSDFLSAADFLSKDPPEPFDVGAVESTRLNALRQAWSGYTLRSGDHHDLNNLLGPIVWEVIFGEQDQELRSKDAIGANALLRFMKCSSLIPNRSPRVPESFSRKGKRRKSLNVLVIDDEFSLGWENLLRLELPRLAVADDWQFAFLSAPDQLVDSLVKQSESRPDEQVLMPENSGQRRHADLLFLDLRLFSRNAIEEKVFFLKLIALYQTGIRINRWRDESLTNDRLELLRKAFDSVSSNDWLEYRRRAPAEYLEGLTFLVRFIAQQYFTTPVVVFSSSGRREVLELLRPYGNVITKFEKPRFPYSESEAGIARDNLRQVMKEAVDLIEMRERFATLRQSIRGIDQLPVFIAADDASIAGPYVEIYTDETGKESWGDGFSLSAIVVVYKSEQDALKLNNSLSTITFSHDGLQYSLAARTPITARPLPKGTDAKQKDRLPSAILEGIVALNEWKHGVLGAFGLQLDGPAVKAVDEACPPLLADKHADSLYEFMVRVAVELVLFDILPATIRRDFTWGGYFATRARDQLEFLEAAGSKDPLPHAENLHARFGVESLVKKKPDRSWRYPRDRNVKTFPRDLSVGGPYDFVSQTFATDSFAPLVRSILSARESTRKAQEKRCLAARGVPLNLERPEEHQRPRLIAALADWAANFRRDRLNSQLHGWPSLEPLLGFWVTGRITETTSRLLASSRAFDNRDYTEAIGYLLASAKTGEGEADQISALLIAHLSRGLNNKDGFAVREGWQMAKKLQGADSQEEPEEDISLVAATGVGELIEHPRHSVIAGTLDPASSTARPGVQGFVTRHNNRGFFVRATSDGVDQELFITAEGNRPDIAASVRCCVMDSYVMGYREAAVFMD